MAKRQNAQYLSPDSKRLRKDGEASFKMSLTDTWISCGKCANSLGLVPLAIKSFERAVSQDESNVEALKGLSYALRMNDISLNETTGSQNSIKQLNKSLERYPSISQNPQIFKELAECYLLIGLNEQAHQAIQAAIQLDSNNPSLWLLSAQTMIRTGARSHAANALNHCLSILPDSLSQFSESDIETARGAHAELAAIAAADGNMDVSTSELTATLSLPPPPLSRMDEHVALWCALATAKERAEDIEGAIKVCERAEKAVPYSERISMTHAYLLLLSSSKDNSSLSISLLNKIVASEPGTEQGQPSSEGDFLPWFLLGKAYSILSQPRLAYDCYQVALRRASNSPITWLAVGKLYLELGQLPDSLAAYSQALRLQMDENSPGTATAWDGLSSVYERCDDQLADASDACSRSGACLRAIGDEKNATFFEQRAKALSMAAKKEGPVPPLRDPSDVSGSLLRDLVALLPSERIEYIQGTQQRGAIGRNGVHQETPLEQNPSSHNPPPTESNSATMTPRPQPPQQHTPLHNFYPAFKQDQSSPRPPQQIPHPSQQTWSPNQPPYFYQQGPPPIGHIPPPPPMHHGQARSPLPQPMQMMPNGGYSMVPPGPPGPLPPGYTYGQYVPVQGGVVTHLQQYAAPVSHWRR